MLSFLFNNILYIKRMANIPMKRFNFIKHSGAHEIKTHQMGIGRGNQESNPPPMTEAQTYSRFHNEFMNRTQFKQFMVDVPLSIHKDPSDYMSVGNLKQTIKHAGRDENTASFGFSKKHLSCNCGCKATSQKHIDMKHAGGKPNRPAHNKAREHPKKITELH